MTTIKTYNNTELIVIEVTEDAYNEQITSSVSLDFKQMLYLIYSHNTNVNLVFLGESTCSYDLLKVLGKLSELSEEECIGLIEYKNENPLDWKFFNYQIKMFDENNIDFTAKESFISLLQSQGVDTSKHLLILEKL